MKESRYDYLSQRELKKMEVLDQMSLTLESTTLLASARSTASTAGKKLGRKFDITPVGNGLTIIVTRIL